MFENRKKAVLEEIENLKKTLDLLEYKCWYYDKAIEDGNEEGIHEMLPDKLPEAVQKRYDRVHQLGKSAEEISVLTGCSEEIVLEVLNHGKNNSEKEN